MSENQTPVPVKTVLYTVATENLDREVEDDLKRSDPTMDRAKAAIEDNCCGKCADKDTNKGNER